LNAANRKVYVVDDDAAVSKGVCRLLRSAGYEPQAFNSAMEFVQYYRASLPGCLVLDVSMPGISGLELQSWLEKLNSPLQIVFLTAQGDIPTSVNAMKHGAVDFLTKPVNETALFKAVEEALRRAQKFAAARTETEAILTRLATLTAREREVLEHIVSGQLNKQVAAQLGTVEKTIKVHRARVMEKMGVTSVAELARMAEKIGIANLPVPSSASPAPPAPPNHRVSA